mmetsp:Transcript_770/g.1839  ORF Transcript_770/g.1839 Transcript_770/m.1839 type:complete len:86 (+) Transcript_770:198-455(+)
MRQQEFARYVTVEERLQPKSRRGNIYMKFYYQEDTMTEGRKNDPLLLLSKRERGFLNPQQEELLVSKIDELLLRDPKNADRSQQV